MANHGSLEPGSPRDRLLVVSGDLDMATVDSYVGQAAAELSGEPATLILDFGSVGFCDSAGINGLVQIRKRCDDAGWRMRVINVRPPVRRVIVDLTGLGQFLGVETATGG